MSQAETKVISMYMGALLQQFNKMNSSNRRQRLEHRIYFEDKKSISFETRSSLAKFCELRSDFYLL